MATHWEVVGKGDERAIAIISFSCPEASALRPETPKHVRANLFVSMYLLRPTPSRDLRNGNEQCHFTRYLSFDLAGTVNTHLSNAITIQQATIPVIITEFLQRTEPTVEDRYNGLLTNETVVNSVIKHTAHGSTTIGSLPLLRPPSPLSGEDDLCHPKLAYDIEHGNGRVPSVESQAIVLFAPVVLYYILDFCIIPGAALSFCIAGFLAIRQVVLWFVGEAMSLSDEQSFLGPVTCRFSVDLKGIHRFIANKKEEQDELNNGNTEISLVHIVACSLARALKKEPTLICRRIVIPWLWIDRVVDRRFDPVNVSVSENGSGLVTLKNVDVRKVQSLANDLAAADRRTNATRDICQCLVISSSSVDSEMVTEAAPVQRDVCVVAIIGGIRMERMSKPRRNNGTNGESRRPFLSLSLTISRQQQQSDIVTCRRFAGEVRKLLAYPEILESE